MNARLPELSEEARSTLWTMLGFELLTPLITFVVLMSGAWLIGRTLEQRHLARIAAGEAQLRGITASTCAPEIAARNVQLVSGSVVVANDLFKAWRAGVRSLFGGQITHYETMVMRARREALLRLKAEAQELGSTHVCGVRFQTTSIGMGRGAGAVEVIATGTAIY